jgi:hypothetical protein
MEADILKQFINMKVEVLVGGQWIRGTLCPIVKQVCVLLPLGEEAEFYGPASMKMDAIQAIRQVKTQDKSAAIKVDAINPNLVKSAFNTADVSRFVIDKGKGK